MKYPASPRCLTPCQAPSSSLTYIGDMSHIVLGPDVASSLSKECPTAQVGRGGHTHSQLYSLLTPQFLQMPAPEGCDTQKFMLPIFWVGF